MGGMFIDTFVMYGYKALSRLVEFLGSMRWKKVTGTVLDYSVRDSPVGCTLLTVYYQLDSAVGSRVESEEIPFLSPGDAERYARRFIAEREISVRVDPLHKTLTHFFIRDQKDVSKR